jgi:hypothetical protein
MKIYLLKVKNVLIIPKSYISRQFNTISSIKVVRDIVLLLMPACVDDQINTKDDSVTDLVI